MPKQITIDEMLDILIGVKDPRVTLFKRELENLAARMADGVAWHARCRVTHQPTFQGVAFAGCCATFGPVKPGDAVPALLAEYDESADWP